MISCEDFKVDGKVDWDAYRAARLQAGEECIRCGDFIFPPMLPSSYPAKLGPRLCYSCKEMDTSAEEVDSEDYIRCPYCSHRMSVHDGDSYDLFEDGHHDVSCGECGKDFEVKTSVSYSFESPAMVN